MTQALIMDKGEQFYGKKKQWPPKNDKKQRQMGGRPRHYKLFAILQQAWD